ncbi:hypothetical protein Tco_1492914 [Tanacetum coccineum]
MQTEMELTLEQTQQGVSYEVSVDPHGFEGTNKDGNRDFRYSDTVRPSQIDEVLNLKNFEKDASLQLLSCQIKKVFKITTHIQVKVKDMCSSLKSQDLQHIQQDEVLKQNQVCGSTRMEEPLSIDVCCV